MRETLYRQVDAEYALQREKNMLEQEARQAQAEAAGSGGDGEDARGGGLGVGAVGRVQVVYG